MMRATRSMIAVLCVTGFMSMPLQAADPHEERVKRDLFAVIALKGQPCGVVVSFTRQGETDYLAVCQTGDRYRVTMAPEGRVKVEKQ